MTEVLPLLYDGGYDGGTTLRRPRSTSSPVTGSWPCFGAPAALEDHALRALSGGVGRPLSRRQRTGGRGAEPRWHHPAICGSDSTPARVIAGEIGSGPMGYTADRRAGSGMAQRMESARRRPGGVMLSEVPRRGLVEHATALGESEFGAHQGFPTTRWSRRAGLPGGIHRALSRTGRRGANAGSDGHGR